MEHNTELTYAEDPVAKFYALLVDLPRDVLPTALGCLEAFHGFPTGVTSIRFISSHLDSIALSNESNLKPWIDSSLAQLSELFDNSSGSVKTTDAALELIRRAISDDFSDAYWQELGSIDRLKNWHGDVPDECPIQQCSTTTMIVSRKAGMVTHTKEYYAAKESQFPYRIPYRYDPDCKNRIRGQIKYCHRCQQVEAKWSE